MPGGEGRVIKWLWREISSRDVRVRSSTHVATMYPSQMHTHKVQDGYLFHWWFLGGSDRLDKIYLSRVFIPGFYPNHF